MSPSRGGVEGVFPELLFVPDMLILTSRKPLTYVGGLMERVLVINQTSWNWTRILTGVDVKSILPGHSPAKLIGEEALAECVLKLPVPDT